MFLQEPFSFTCSSGDFPILLDLVALQLCVLEKLSCNLGLFEVGFKCIRAQLGNKVFMTMPGKHQTEAVCCLF